MNFLCCHEKNAMEYTSGATHMICLFKITIFLINIDFILIPSKCCYKWITGAHL